MAATREAKPSDDAATVTPWEVSGNIDYGRIDDAVVAKYMAARALGQSGAASGGGGGGAST